MALGTVGDELAQSQESKAELRKKLSQKFGSDLAYAFIRYKETPGASTHPTNRSALVRMIVSSLQSNPTHVIELFLTLYEDQEERIRVLEESIQR